MENGNEQLILGTSSGLVIAGCREGDWRVQSRLLSGKNVTSLVVRGEALLVGTRAGIFHSTDFGMTWQEAGAGLTTRLVRWMAGDPHRSETLLAGTEPAAIFISKDGGLSWRECPEVAGLRQRFGWFLPYSPLAGCVRGFALRSALPHDQRVYAAVEVGGVLLSEDGSETWRMAEGSTGSPDMRTRGGFIHPDVHSIEVHPSSPDLVYAPTGGGFYRSRDGGKTWESPYQSCYCRAVWVDPQDPEHLVLGPADNVDRDGRIESSRDGGLTWEPASAGLDTPWREHMVERFAQAGDELLAVLSNGELLAAPLDTLHWRRVLPDIKDINAVAWAAG